MMMLRFEGGIRLCFPAQRLATAFYITFYAHDAFSALFAAPQLHARRLGETTRFYDALFPWYRACTAMSAD